MHFFHFQKCLILSNLFVLPTGGRQGSESGGSEKRNDFLNSARVCPEPRLCKPLLFVPGTKGGWGIQGERMAPFVCFPDSWSNFLAETAPPLSWFPGKWSAILYLPCLWGSWGGGRGGRWSKHNRILEKEVFILFSTHKNDPKGRTAAY